MDFFACQLDEFDPRRKSFARIAAPIRAVISTASKAGNSIFVGRQTGAIQMRKGGRCVLLAAQAKRAVEQAITEPFKANRYLEEPP